MIPFALRWFYIEEMLLSTIALIRAGCRPDTRPAAFLLRHTFWTGKPLSKVGCLQWGASYNLQARISWSACVSGRWPADRWRWYLQADPCWQWPCPQPATPTAPPPPEKFTGVSTLELPPQQVYFPSLPFRPTHSVRPPVPIASSCHLSILGAFSPPAKHQREKSSPDHRVWLKVIQSPSNQTPSLYLSLATGPPHSTRGLTLSPTVFAASSSLRLKVKGTRQGSQRASLVTQMVKNPLAMAETRVRSLG